jgi:phosphatidate cytidylyltransferase
MSPSAALESRVFLTYAAVVGALLVVAGLALLVLRAKRPAAVAHAARSYRSWLVMAPLLLGAVFLGRVPAVVFFTLLALFGFKEFARATGLYRNWAMTGAVYLGIVATCVVTLVRDPADGTAGWYGLFIVLPVYVVAGILLIPILQNRVQGQLQALALAIVGYVYVGWMFGHLAFLANATHAYGYLLYLVFAVEVNDVAAYVCGKTFGRHPLRSRISPNKTWEGAIGALLVSLALPFALWFSFPHFTVPQLLLAGLVVGVGGQLGDLAISVIKRDLGIKDMGAVIPGHGGLLDRIDSLVYVAPLFLHMARYFHGLA